MSEIEIGKIRASSPLLRRAVTRSFAIPPKTLVAHTCAVGVSAGDDGLTALALKMAKGVVERGGRVLVLDAMPGEQCGGRLQQEFVRNFPGMEVWTRRDSLSDVKSFLVGEVRSPVAYIGGVGVHDSTRDVPAAVVAALGDAVSEIVESLGREGAAGKLGLSLDLSRLQLVIVRSASVKPITASMMRSLNMGVLHLLDADAVSAEVQTNSVTRIRVAPTMEGAHDGAPGRPLSFDGLVEMGYFFSPFLVERLEIDGSILSPLPAQLNLTLGSLRRGGSLSWLGFKQKLSLPWQSMRRNLRVEMERVGEGPATALTMALARQMLAGGGRVIVVDPLAVQRGIIGSFAAQLLHAFPSLQWVDETSDLGVVAKLVEEGPLSAADSMAIVTGEAVAPVVKQEGEYGALAHRPVFEAMHMAVFAQMLKSSPHETTDRLPPVLVVLRNVPMDRRTVMHLAELANGNIAIVHLDSGRLRDEVELFAGTVVSHLEYAGRRGGRTFFAQVRTAGGQASLPIEYTVDVASTQELREVGLNSNLASSAPAQ